MKRILLIICFIAIRLPYAVAQGCVVCTNTANQLNDKSARGLNGGIIYLAFLPLIIMFTLGFIWWRSNKKAI